MQFSRFSGKLCSFWVAAVCTVTLPGLALPASFYPAGRYPNAVVTGDFNGDGKPDLAVANFDVNGYVSILLDSGDGTFQTAPSYAAVGDATSVAVGDFNGDGKADLVVANFAINGHVSILLNKGDCTF